MEVNSEHLELVVNGTRHTSIAFFPRGKGDLPVVFVFPEWWGLVDFPKERAEALAKLGYYAIAVDVYGEQKMITDPAEATILMNELMASKEAISRRFLPLYELVQSNEKTSQKRQGAIGYCMGGAIAIDLAKQKISFKGVVSFHGSLITPSRVEGVVTSKLLILHGEKDSLVSKKELEKFESEMKDARGDGNPDIKFRIEILPGAKHGFSNPKADENGKKYGLPLAYSKAADTKSWDLMRDFLGANL